ncbi:MAG: formate dehydrogenase subunit alpha [bacterium]|nr:formate dehydrogenase subunit alpha [bacterium]
MPDIPEISFLLDGKKVRAAQGDTIWEAAAAQGGEIPRLCYQPGLSPAGVCRVCAVEVAGARVLAPSCCRAVEAGMEVSTKGARVVRAQRALVRMLMADHPSPCAAESEGPGCELEALARDLGVAANESARTASAGMVDISSSVITVDLNACILCDRCIRACADVQGNHVIGRAGKGAAARIVFDAEAPMGASSCVSCGECAAACPTGALVDKPLVESETKKSGRKVDSLCPYCGVGCAITYQVKGNRIVAVEGRSENTVNQGRLCVKGRYGYDYAHHEGRLTVPLIRKEGAPKTAALPTNPLSLFREGTWEEALSRTAGALVEIKNAHGSSALAGFGSAKCSNEECYLFQKLIRAALGTNNVDHCTRLCHASSVAALMETIGSGAVSNPFSDVMQADFIFVAGSNTTENHPVAATFIKEAVEKGATLAVADPRRIDLVRHASIHLRFRPGTDVAVFNGLLHVVIEEGLYDREFVERRTEGFGELQKEVKAYSPERVARITGVPAALIRETARRYAASERSICFWGMGLSQHTTGTDNCRALIALCLICGQIGRPGTGLHPLRGQNNVQGASDVGLIPMVYPGYQDVTRPEVRAKFERAWGRPLDAAAGLTVMEVMHAAHAGEIRGMYIMGENPAMSDPNLNLTREALARLAHLTVQDIFLTETAAFADVILPATAFPEKTGTYTNTDRRVQLGRKAVEPPGQARVDWRIIAELAERMGYPMDYASPEEIFAEIAELTPQMAGLTYARLEKGGVSWPCPALDHPGTAILFEERFPTPTGRGRLVPVAFAPPHELPDRKYPFVLNTGRNLYHWHTGAMTRRAGALDAAEPAAYVEINEADLRRKRISDGALVRVRSRRGEIELAARKSPRVRPGEVFIPFHYVEAAANLLTVDVLDPWGKIPEFKVCAVQVEKV